MPIRPPGRAGRILLSSWVTLLLLLPSGLRAPAEAAWRPDRVLEFVFGGDPPAWRHAPGGWLPEAADLPLLAESAAPCVPYRDVLVLLPLDTSVLRAAFVPEGVVPASPPGAPAVAAPLAVSTGDSVAVARLPVAGEHFPGMWGEHLGTATWHGHRLATFRLYPLRLERDRPDGDWSGALWAGRLRLELELAPGEPAVRRQRDPAGETAALRARLAELVHNPEELALYPPPPSPAADPGGGAEGAAQADWAPNLSGPAVEMLIVTGAALAGEFQRLADHRTARGVPAVVRTIDDILAGYPSGGDAPETLRRYLRDAYQLWGTKHVLLGGDVDVVPTRRILNTLYPPGQGTEMPVDLYYACLDGDWNADGDEWLCEPFISTSDPGDDADLAAELLVGRLPARTAAEAAVLVDKVLQYEQQGGAHQGRMLLLSEVLFPSDWSAGQPIVEDGAAYSETMLAEVFTPAPAAPHPVRLYEAHSQWPGAHPQTRAAVIDSLNRGDYGLVNHIGHGFYYNMSVGDQSLDLAAAAGLRNGNDTFVLTSLNCSSSAFDYNCILERFLLNPLGGAVATLGSVRAAFPNTAARYQLEFYRGLLLGGAATLGEAVAASRLPFDGLTAYNTTERWTHLTTALLGDPAQHVRTMAPAGVDVEAPSQLAYGEQVVPVRITRAGAPVPGALVCLEQTGNDYARGRTDADGRVWLTLTVKSPAAVALRVTAPNAPLLDLALPVTPAAQPYVRLAAAAIVDDGTLGSHGNGDGVPNAGETLALILTLRNDGTAPSGAAATVLLAGASGAEVLDGAATLAALAPGGSAVASPPLRVRIAADVLDAAMLPLELGVADGARLYRDRLALQPRAPTLQIGLLTAHDHPHGDGDGLIEPGEIISVRFILLNTGGGAAAGVTGRVESADSRMQIVAGEDAWPSIPPLAEISSPVGFLLRPLVVANDVKATLHLTDAYGRTWSHVFDLVAPGQAQVNAITAPATGEVLLRWTPLPLADLFGYHVYRADAPMGDYARLTSLPITGGTFYRDTGLPPLTRFYYRVAAVDSSRQAGRQSLTAVVSTVPAEAPGFPLPLAAETSSHAAVGDVTGDGRPEIILAADHVYVWNADGVELRDGDNDPSTSGPFNDLSGLWGPAGVALGDLTTHPGLEIVTSYRTGKQVYVYQGDGTIAPGWPRTMTNWNWAAPALGDLDGDGDLEIVVTTVDGRTYVWHHDGSDFHDGDGNPATIGLFQIRPQEWYSFCSPALADLTGDGRLEIVLGTRYSDSTADRIHALRNDGSDAPGWPVILAANADMLCSPAVGDLDGDGSLEVLLITENDRLHVLNADGTPRPPFPIVFVANNASSGTSCPSPALADFDGDGVLEIVAVSVTNARQAEIHVLNLQGQNLPGWPRAVAGASESSPIVGDLTGEGTPAVLFGIGGADDSTPNLLYALRANGGAVPGFPLQLDGPIRPAPTLADLDGDGKVEIVYGGWDLRLHVWDLPAVWSPARMPWPTFKGNVQRTGVHARPALTDVPAEASSPAAPSLSQNHPNPFNPRTRIAFNVPAGAPGRVRLSIYDLKGRLVARLVDGPLAPGTHGVEWSGLDGAGRPAASGVYLYRLETPGGRCERRMVLVR